MIAKTYHDSGTLHCLSTLGSLGDEMVESAYEYARPDSRCPYGYMANLVLRYKMQR